jgi:hypothetical protein
MLAKELGIVETGMGALAQGAMVGVVILPGPERLHRLDTLGSATIADELPGIGTVKGSVEMMGIATLLA